jgi:hypothetical protein
MRWLQIGKADRRLRIVAWCAVVACLAALLTGIFQSGGYRTSRLELNDAGIWVTNQGDRAVGKLNAEIQLIDTTLDAKGTRPDVLQSDSTVLVTDSLMNRLWPVDVHYNELGKQVQLTDGSVPLLGGQTLAIARGDQVRVGSAAQPATVANAKPAFDLGTATGKVAAVVGVDGVVHVATGAGRVQDLKVTGAKGNSHQFAAEWKNPTITSVGSQSVVLNNEKLYLPGQKPVSLPASQYGAGAKLQQPGPANGFVLVATDRQLLRVSLDGGGIKQIFSAGDDGEATPPVWLGGCSFGAWKTTPAKFAQACDGAQVRGGDLTGLSAGDLVFRVNRNRVELNDLGNGHNLLFTSGKPVRVDTWDKAQSVRSGPGGEDTGEAKTNGKNTALDVVRPPHQGRNNPPVLQPDIQGTRPGRPVVVNVLANDFDADGDPLTVTEVGPLSGAAPGQAAQIVDNGRAVQVPAPATKLTPIAFDYTATDNFDARTSHVTVELHQDNENQDPVVPSQSVTIGGGQSATVDLLAGASDPDGDPLALAGVTASAGSVQARADGQVRVTAPLTGGQPYPVRYTVLDDHGGSQAGALTVQVQPAEDLRPIPHDDQILLVSGRTATVNVLTNDVSPSGAPLQLVPLVSDSKLLLTSTPDGLVQVTSSELGIHEVLYTVSDGAGHTQQAFLRVNVIAAEAEQPPIAVRDDVALSPGRSAIVPVLANDRDPAGSVLSVQSVNVPASSGLVVQLVGRSAVRVTAQSEIKNAVSFSYVVTNGIRTAAGTVVVRGLPVASGGPVAERDVVTIRAGAATSVKVLANDYSPSGADLKLVSVLPPAAGKGTLFVQGNEVRFVAPAVVGEVPTQYVVADSSGQRTTGQILFHVIAATDVGNRMPFPQTLVARVVAGRQTTITIPLSGIDPDGDSTILQGLESAPRLGQIVSVGTNTIVYRANRDAKGTDGFTYSVRDPYKGVGIGAVQIGIIPISTPNSPPTAVPDSAEVRPGESVRIDAAGNDSDPDGDPVSLDTSPRAVQQPTVGKAAIDGGVIVFTAPRELPSGVSSSSFTYQVTDGRGGKATGLVTVQIDPNAGAAPIAVDDVLPPQPAGKTVAVNVLDNDRNPAGNASDLRIISRTPTNVVIVNGRQLQLKMPDHAVYGSYTVKNGNGSASALFTIPVEANLPPQTVPDTRTTDVGKRVTINVLGNDRSRSNSTLILKSATKPAHGQTSPSLPDSVNYTPDPGYTGEDTFGYTVADAGGSAVGTVSVLVGSVRSVLTFTPLPISVQRGESQTLDLSRAVTSPGANGSLTFSDLRGTGGGVSATLNGEALMVSVAKDAPIGVVPLSVSVSNGLPGGVTNGTIPVTVTADHPGEFPTAVPDAAPPTTGSPVSIDVTGNDINPAGGDLVVTLLSKTATGGEVSNDGSRVTFDPRAGFIGQSAVTYVIADKNGRTSESTVTFTVVAVQKPLGKPDRPVAREGIESATLTWNPVAGDVASYEVRNPAGALEACQSSGCSIPGLAAGQAISFQVRAISKTGDQGPWSDLSNSVIPEEGDAGPPVEPSGSLVVGADGAVRVTWADASASVAGYQVMITAGSRILLSQPYPGGPSGSSTTVPFGSELPNACTPLSPGGDVQFSVTAQSASGVASPPHQLTQNFRRTAIPPVPAAPIVTPGVHSVTLNVELQCPVSRVQYGDSNGGGTTVRNLPSNGVIDQLNDATGAYFFAVQQCATDGTTCSGFGATSQNVTPQHNPVPIADITSIKATVHPLCPSENWPNDPVYKEKLCEVEVTYSVAASDVPIKYTQWWTDQATDPLHGPFGSRCDVGPCLLSGADLSPGYRGLSENGNYTDTWTEGWYDAPPGGTVCVWVRLIFADGTSNDSARACTPW